MRSIKCADEQRAMVEAFSRLMQIERRLLQVAIVYGMPKTSNKTLSARIPFFKLFLRHLQRRMRGLGLRLGQFIIDRLINRDPVTRDVHEKIAPLR